MTKKPLAGVIDLVAVAEHLFDYEVRDLGWDEEQHRVAKELREQAVADGEPEDHIVDRDFERPAAEQMSDDNFISEGPILLGGWCKNAEGKWAPDLTMYSFAAMWHTDSGTVQVVSSKFVRLNCRMASPCYPDQGNLAEGGGGVIAYCLPPGFYFEETYTDIVHVNWLEQGYVEDGWDDRRRSTMNRVKQHVCSMTKISADDWVHYKSTMQRVKSEGDVGAEITYINEYGHLMSVSAVLYDDPAIVYREARLFLDTNDKVS